MSLPKTVGATTAKIQNPTKNFIMLLFCLLEFSIITVILNFLYIFFGILSSNREFMSHFAKCTKENEFI